MVEHPEYNFNRSLGKLFVLSIVLHCVLAIYIFAVPQHDLLYLLFFYGVFFYRYFQLGRKEEPRQSLEFVRRVSRIAIVVALVCIATLVLRPYFPTLDDVFRFILGVSGGILSIGASIMTAQTLAPLWKASEPQPLAAANDPVADGTRLDS